MNLSPKQLNRLATFAGFCAAIANAWMTIDWVNFNAKTDVPKLILSAAIAAGGYLSTFQKKQS